MLPDTRLVPTGQELASIAPEPIENNGEDLWPWLVGLAAIPLWLEWWLFYSKRGVQKNVAKPQIPVTTEPFDRQVAQSLHSSNSETHHFIN
jgi:hypothetical protein